MDIQSVDRSQVMSVYSGKAGRCCCGCSGKHYYASEHRSFAGKDRGYAIGDDEVNDSMVTKVLRTVQANADSKTFNEVEPEGSFTGHFSVEVGARVYIVYLTKGVK